MYEENMSWYPISCIGKLKREAFKILRVDDYLMPNHPLHASGPL